LSWALPPWALVAAAALVLIDSGGVPIAKPKTAYGLFCNAHRSAARLEEHHALLAAEALPTGQRRATTALFFLLVFEIVRLLDCMRGGTEAMKKKGESFPRTNELVTFQHIAHQVACDVLIVYDFRCLRIEALAFPLPPSARRKLGPEARPGPRLRLPALGRLGGARGGGAGALRSPRGGRRRAVSGV
jgi:hypothetical protein